MDYYIYFWFFWCLEKFFTFLAWFTHLKILEEEVKTFFPCPDPVGAVVCIRGAGAVISQGTHRIIPLEFLPESLLGKVLPFPK